MSIVERNHVPISADNIHALFETESCMAISCAGLLSNHFQLSVVENDFGQLKLRVLAFTELMLFTYLMKSMIEALRCRGVQSLIAFLVPAINLN